MQRRPSSIGRLQEVSLNRLEAFERFALCATSVARVQMQLVDAAKRLFTREELENMKVGVGEEGWEVRLYALILKRTAAYYNLAHGIKDDDLSRPQLRVWNCGKCDMKNTSLQTHGACCYGQPQCCKCGFQTHDDGCTGRRGRQG
jgi:hypothetical protein